MQFLHSSIVVIVLEGRDPGGGEPADPHYFNPIHPPFSNGKDMKKTKPKHIYAFLTFRLQIRFVSCARHPFYFGNCPVLL